MTPRPHRHTTTSLALRQPGSWTSEYHRHPTHQEQFPTVERLWHAGHVDYIVSQYVLGHDAVLNGPEGQEFYVTDRPLYRRQFVVAALEPAGRPAAHAPGHRGQLPPRRSPPAPTAAAASKAPAGGLLRHEIHLPA